MSGNCEQCGEVICVCAEGQSILTIGLERERIMLQWDIWRQYIANGGTASWPRDEFEAILDAYDEIIAG